MGRVAFGRFLRPAVIAAAAVAVYAALGFFVVPPIARSQIVKQARALLHRDATVRRVAFNPFTLTARLEGLDLRDTDGSDLLALDRLTLNLQISSLFRRAWTFKELSIEGPRAVARILPDGRLSVADLFAPAPGAPPPAPRKGLPRLIVGRLALSRGSVRFVDASRAPPFEETLAPLDLDVRDLTTVPDREGDHAVTIGFGEKARLKWTGHQVLEPLHLEGRFEVTGISLPRLWAYAASASPLELRDGRADVSWTYDVRKSGDDLSFSLGDGAVTVSDVALRPKGGADDWLKIPRVEVRGTRAAWPAATVDVDSIRLVEPWVVAFLEKGGTTNWQEASAGSSSTRAGPAPDASPARKPWTVRIAEIAIANGGARLEDRTFAPPVSVDLADTGLTLENVSSDRTAPVAIEASARVNGGGEAKVSGTVVPEPFEAELGVDVKGVDLVPLNPYLRSLPGAAIRKGAASLDGTMRLSSGSPSFRFDGNASVEALELSGAGTDRLLAWERARARGILVTLSPKRLRIADLGLERPFAKIFIDREGRFNLSKLTAEPSEAGRAEPGEGSGSGGESFPIDVGSIAIRDATVNYTDESLILPFGTEIHAANGTIRDLSTTSAAAARLDLEGRVADAGFVKAGGVLRVADPFASTDISVTFRGVPMPTLTPYVAQFAGYAVKSGSLDLDVRYRIQDRRLVGDHKVVATDMVLGGKVEGTEGAGLPIRLAIALLKDKDGRIDLQVPVEGSIDSPEFAYRKVFWQAVKKILGNLVKAPFRAIGRMFGKDEEDLDLVGFAAGRSDLLPNERDTLAKIAGELAHRPELSISVGGRFDPETDAAALRRDRLERAIDAKRTATTTLESILEALYAEAFTPEALAAERARFQPEGGAFDAAGFYDALRAKLLDAQPVTAADLEALARARAQAVVGGLTAPGGLDASRVVAGDPGPVSRKKRGSDLVPSEMTLSAKD